MPVTVHVLYLHVLQAQLKLPAMPMLRFILSLIVVCAVVSIETDGSHVPEEFKNLPKGRGRRSREVRDKHIEQEELRKLMVLPAVASAGHCNVEDLRYGRCRQHSDPPPAPVPIPPVWKQSPTKQEPPPPPPEEELNMYAEGHPKGIEVSDELGNTVPMLKPFHRDDFQDQHETWDPDRIEWKATSQMWNITMNHMRRQRIIDIHGPGGARTPGLPQDSPNALPMPQSNRVNQLVPGTNIIRNQKTGAEFTVEHPSKGRCVVNEKTGRTNCLPSLIHIGVGHGGSTSLYHYLASHPQLVSNDVAHKGKPGRETWFFNRMWNIDWSVKQAISAYADLFPSLEEGGMQTTFEKTPVYWKELEVPARMASVVPNATIVMFLRNPVTWLHSRFYPDQQNAVGGSQSERKKAPEQIAAEESHFEMMLAQEGWDLCKQLPIGIRELLLHYPRDQIIIELSERFKADPISLLRRVEKSLELTPKDWDEKALSKEKHHVQQRPKISSQYQKLIRDRCKQPILELEQILGMEIQSVWDGLSDVTV